MSGFEKDFITEVEKKQYDVILNVDIKQEFIDFNLNYNQFSQFR